MSDLDKMAEVIADKHTPFGDYGHDDVIGAIRAALLTAPPGYKLMPVEHTDAIYSAWCDAPYHEDDDICFSRAYSAMLAAAPEPTP